MLSSMLSYVKPSVLNALHEGGRVCPPLLVAAMKGDVQTVDLLLAHGVDVNVGCDRGETALHMAIRSNNASLVEQLLHRGACIDTHDVTIGCSRPLDMAVYKLGREGLVTSHLINSNRFVKAVVRHDLKLVKFLLASGVSPNVNTSMYGTPLHMAVRNRQYRMISTILSSDQCRTDLQYKGVTPLDYAIAMDDARAARIMIWRDDEKRRQRTRHLSLSIFDRKKRPIAVKPSSGI